MRKHISILVPYGAELMDLIGAWQAFSFVNEYLESQRRSPAFRLKLVGNGAVGAGEGQFWAQGRVPPTAVFRTDLIVIPSIGWNCSDAVQQNEYLLPWILSHYRKGAELMAIGTGSFLLAAAGLFNGRSCTTHWAAAELFRSMFPGVTLLDAIVTEEDRIYTNAGGVSFIHVVIRLIEKYCGRETAVVCTKMFQTEMQGSSQAQFAMFDGIKDHRDREILRAQFYIEQNLRLKINFAQLAEESGLPRNTFDRRFLHATATTPHEYQQRLRIEAARKLLESSGKSPAEVMEEVGYSDISAFRRVFKRITGSTPFEYRSKYHP